MSDSNDRVDVLVIGAGASGAAFTWSLVKDGFDVLCLEQGGWTDPSQYPPTQMDWETHRQTDFNANPNNRGLPEDYPVNDSDSAIAPLMYNAVGGSTIHWSAHFPRFHPSDFRTRDPRRRRRRLAADIRRTRTILRHQRPHHGRRGHDGRHRLPTQIRAPDPAAPARTPGTGYGPRIRQARLALVAFGRHHPDRPLRRTRRLQQLRTVRHRLHSPRQGFHRRHILAQGAGARRADSRPTAESGRSP